MTHSESNLERCEPNLVPLLDLVLQLIMFFIVCVSFKAQDYNSKDVQLPVAQSARPLERSGEEPLFLNINERGELLPGPGLEPLTTPSAIKDFLSKEYTIAKRVAEERKRPGVKTVIIIRGHRSADFDYIYQIMRLCKEVGFTRIQLRATQRGGA